MPTDLPYAADAEESLGYEELEVSSTCRCCAWTPFGEDGGVASWTSTKPGNIYPSSKDPPQPVREGDQPEPCDYADQVQLWSVFPFMGFERL